ncbi:hypothetical protein SAMN05444371_0332 [Epilithonimonas mollis]|uniref:Uncharacterized protein n=1 Tax=Epilithonimonas mollis TaxID=216903 RepID=A0A1M6NC47_9FLAO|nr:hypothetical protein SAMN05444371_0332 [Epilithonimonas mollis]
MFLLKGQLVFSGLSNLIIFENKKNRKFLSGCLLIFSFQLLFLRSAPRAERSSFSFLIKRKKREWSTDKGAQISYPSFLESATNCARPESVSGCFSRLRIDGRGEVITSAPIFAQLMICIGLLMDAARISVSKA